MAALDRIEIPGIGKEIAKRAMAIAIWDWFDMHKDEVIFEKRILFLSVKLRIRDFQFLIERIAGKRSVFGNVGG